MLNHPENAVNAREGKFREIATKATFCQSIWSAPSRTNPSVSFCANATTSTMADAVPSQPMSEPPSAKPSSPPAVRKNPSSAATSRSTCGEMPRQLILCRNIIPKNSMETSPLPPFSPSVTQNYFFSLTFFWKFIVRNYIFL